MKAPRDFFAAVTALTGLEQLDVDGMRLLYRVECSGEESTTASPTGSATPGRPSYCGGTGARSAATPSASARRSA
jgi:hypothetical protein